MNGNINDIVICFFKFAVGSYKKYFLPNHNSSETSCFCISSPIFSSHKLPIVKNIQVICKGLRHFLNLLKRKNVKLSNISILFVCYVKGDNNIFFFSLEICLLPVYVFEWTCYVWMYIIWGKSESIFCDWLIFSLNYLHWI